MSPPIINATSAEPTKVIIDTDPGIDDAMALFLAFNSPELDVIGLTTIFGNVKTPTATKNALHLCELAERKDIPVAEGEHKTIKGAEKVRVADFVHGVDGLGNTFPKNPSFSKIEKSAPVFLTETISNSPQKVSVIALGPLTNLAKAIELDPLFPKKVKEIVILGGAFFVNGNVNPAAEANIFGDPDAADIVFTCGAKIYVIGINITHQVLLTVEDLIDLKNSNGKYGKYIHDIAQFYYKYHKESYEMDAVYLHDPATIVAAIDKSLFTFQEGVVRVQVDGISKGLTLLNNTNKNWAFPTEWCNKPSVFVANSVDSDKVAYMVKSRLMK